MQRAKKYLIFILVLGIIIGWSVFIYFIGADTIVEKLGVKNSYLIAFFMALFGGTSIITATLYYSTLITVAAGGLNIFLLGLIVGVALTIGDIVFFYFGIAGSRILPKSIDDKMHKFAEWLKNKPRWVVPLVILGYSGFVPLPNDILSITLAVIKQKFKNIVVPIFLGNVILATMVSYAAQQGINFLI